MRRTRRSDTLFRRAKVLIPGGVNSPVRAFKAVGRNPLFIERGKGAYVWDVDGNRYIDYVGSWGPMILGHASPRILKAINTAARRGTSFGAPTELEVKMAELICRLVPSVEMVRMVNSGTEATMSAIRLARAYTGRDKVIKFEGCYHGHADAFLIKAGSGAMTFGTPDSPGVPASIAEHTLTARYNDLESVSRLVSRFKSQVAAVIVEPIVGNMGCIPPQPGFLEGLRKICSRNRVVLIFDEVMTGFRVALGGAQELFGVMPDLTTLGKIIGGGLPVGAYGGKREIMEMVSPRGPMYQAGTLSGNPLAIAAGHEMLTLLSRDGKIYRELEERAEQLEDGIRSTLEKRKIAHRFNRVGSMFTLFFNRNDVTDYGAAKTSDTGRFASFFRELIQQGVYFPPSQFEAAFLSTSHGLRDIRRTIVAVSKAAGHMA
jgi:glutamate-1-semialdehyde 2,1-aminomutase